MRALLVWELGASYGHITQLLDVAKVLASRNWEIFFALKNPSAIDAFTIGFKYSALQAPYKKIESTPSTSPPLLFSDDLRPCGYSNPDELLELLRAWQKIFDDIKPDILIAQSAPTALLASTEASFKRFSIGRGYDTPALSTPMPALRHWKPTPRKHRQKTELIIMESINAALKMLQRRPLENFCDLYAIDRRFLCTFAELDHYPNEIRPRHLTTYYGIFKTPLIGEEVYWNNNKSRKILAYLRAITPSFNSSIKALFKLAQTHDVVLVCPSLSDTACTRFNSLGLRTFNNVITLDKLLPSCDLAISNGNAGFSISAALKATPQLLIPSHIEQSMFARVVCGNGMGRMIIGAISTEDITSQIQGILGEPAYGQACRSFSDQYAGHDSEQLPYRIVDEIESEFVAQT